MRKKALLLYGEISSYNVATFNEIAKEYDLTLAFYTKDKSKLPCDFKKIKLKSKKFGPFVFIKGLRELCNHYDVVCFIPDMHVPSYCILPFIKHNYKTVTWSIGFRCSYVHPYIVNRRHVLLDWVFLQILRKADSNIFYMDESRKFWKGNKLDMNSVFVAPNTTDVLPIEFQPDKKKNLLFVGTLYKGKGLDKLLSSIKDLVTKGYKNIHLTIVGDGECRKELESFVDKNHLNNNIKFTGAIYEEEELSKHFSEALMCISPTQGGMSCPKSMGYGVPFRTRPGGSRSEFAHCKGNNQTNHMMKYTNRPYRL